MQSRGELGARPEHAGAGMLKRLLQSRAMKKSSSTKTTLRPTKWVQAQPALSLKIMLVSQSPGDFPIVPRLS
jgi:hypothetical protein